MLCHLEPKPTIYRGFTQTVLCHKTELVTESSATKTSIIIINHIKLYIYTYAFHIMLHFLNPKEILERGKSHCPGHTHTFYWVIITININIEVRGKKIH